MHFHGVFLGSQHEIWSKQHNGKVSRDNVALIRKWGYVRAVAVFPFGRFEASGDATPDNVTRKMAPHFRRVALTRMYLDRS